MAITNTEIASRDETITLRRRAVFKGLSALLPEKIALTAIKIWQAEFSDKPVYALQPYITRLSEEFELKVARNEIQREIINALSLDPNKLPPDPLTNDDIEKPYLIASEATAKVFSKLLTSFLHGADAHDQTVMLNIRHGISEGIREIQIPSKQYDQLNSMLLKPDDSILLDGLTVDQMKKILHLIYVQLCKHLGPVTSDEMLSEAIKHSEKLPEASNTPPRTFL
jgi:hypothetical protein